jgi:hypothetical protein
MHEWTQNQLFFTRSALSNQIPISKNQLNMKTKLAALALAFTAVASSLHAQLTVPYANGSDGALVITNDTAIDLSQAVTGVWTNTSGSPGNGIYDPTQWAVVFKYSSVDIAVSTTVTFTNHPTHAPVVWLVNGNVTINGTLNLNGQFGNSDSGRLAEPGPGGFRGGGGPVFGSGSGFGPGGGAVFNLPGSYFGTYGNPQIIPLIGGSGGTGLSYNGGAGGGAILIAATGTITVNGYCYADGGSNPFNVPASGGAIRLVANQITGNGTLEALGGNGNSTYVGRIRLEANSFSGGITVNPPGAGTTPSNPATIFPATNSATVTVLNVAGLNAPTDPKASMSASSGASDLSVASTNAVTIQLQTQNFPTNGTVTVYIKPRNSAQTTLTASYVSGNTNAALWQASTTLIYPMYTVIQARATY